MRPLKWYKKRKATRMTVPAEIILDMLVLYKDVTVMSAIATAVDVYKITSRSTAHESLMWLREHGYITVKDGADHREKLYSLTRKGLKYLGIQDPIGEAK